MVREWNDKALNVFLTKTMGGRLNAKLELLTARTIPKALRAEIIHYKVFKEMLSDSSHPFAVVFHSPRRKIVRNTIRSKER